MEGQQVDYHNDKRYELVRCTTFLDSSTPDEGHANSCVPASNYAKKSVLAKKGPTKPKRNDDDAAASPLQNIKVMDSSELSKKCLPKSKLSMINYEKNQMSIKMVEIRSITELLGQRLYKL